MLALICLGGGSSSGSYSAEKKQQISRVIAKEMTAAQKAMQAGQWAEALKQSGSRRGEARTDAVRQEVDRSISRASPISSSSNLKAGQADYEKAMATGAVSAEDKASMTRTLFSIAASTSSIQKTIDYGKEMADAGTATPQRSGHHRAELLPAEGLQEHRRLGGQGGCRRAQGGRGSEGKPVPVQAAVRLGCGRQRRPWSPS